MNDLEYNLIHRFNVGDLLHRNALRYPTKVALHFLDQKLTYRELNAYANRFARTLTETGVQRGDIVAILSGNSPEYVAAFFGCARIGAALAPLNDCYTSEEIDYIINKMEAQALIVESSLLERLNLNGEIISKVSHRFTLGDGVPPAKFRSMSIALTQTDDSAVERFVANDDPATIIFTSGTTARPKGVVNTHLNWYSTLISALADLGINRTHKTLLALPMYHAGGLYTTFFALAIGGEGVILRTRSAPLILEAITTQKVNVVVLPATSWIALLQVPNLETLDLSSLQKLLVFQYLPRPAFNRWRELVPNAEWLNYWGQAEMIPLGSSTPPADLERKLVAPNPIGLPHLPLEIRVIDDDMRNLDPHEIGEFVARGPSVTPGYLGDPEANVALFHGGWHHTGDMGYSDEEGFLYFVDRKKDMIKTGGENVASQEVEEVIAQIPGVIEIAVVGVPDPYWIERVVAVVVSAKGAELSEESVISYVRKHLATFKVPKNVIFVDELPKNPTGKILKREIRKRFESV